MTIGGRGERRIFGTGFVRLIAVLAFAYILFLPVSQGAILLGMFGLMVLAAFLTYTQTKRATPIPIALIALLTFLLGAFGLAVGSRHEDVLNYAGTYIGAPLLFFFCIGALGEETIRILLKTGAIVTVISGAFVLVYVGGQEGILPQIFPASVLELTGAGYGVQDGVSGVRFYGLSTLAAAGPMWLTSLFVPKDVLLPHIRLRALAAAAGISGAAVGGRRAIILSIILIPLVAWAVKRTIVRRRMGPPTIKTGHVMAGLVFSMAGIFLVPKVAAAPIVTDTWQAASTFFVGSASDVSQEDAIRNYQADRLIGAWSESPIWGQGFGATMPGYIRDGFEPSRFELQYHALLMQTGIIGVLFVLAIAATVWWATVKAASLRPDLVPSLIVTVCAGAAMLIANATNPYLQAPAHMWAIFLPLAVINMMLRDPAPKVASGSLPGNSWASVPEI